MFLLLVYAIWTLVICHVEFILMSHRSTREQNFIDPCMAIVNPALIDPPHKNSYLASVSSNQCYLEFYTDLCV